VRDLPGLRQDLRLRGALKPGPPDLPVDRVQAYGWTMTPQPMDEGEVRKDPAGPPLDSADAARQVSHLTGMTPEAATAFISFHSGLRSSPWARRTPGP
jgi:hypothetical protein